MNLKETVDSIGQEVVEAAQRNLGATRKINGKTRRRVASGRLKDGLAFKNLTRNNRPVLQFGVNDATLKNYADVIEFGRRPGAKPPPVQPIIDWMKIKPIRLRSKEGGFVKTTESGIRSAAFLIARSIGKRGIVGIKYYTEALQTVLENRGDDILKAMEKEIETRLNLK
jgi:hypothetical protein